MIALEPTGFVSFVPLFNSADFLLITFVLITFVPCIRTKRAKGTMVSYFLRGSLLWYRSTFALNTYLRKFEGITEKLFSLS